MNLECFQGCHRSNRWLASEPVDCLELGRPLSSFPFRLEAEVVDCIIFGFTICVVSSDLIEATD